MSRILTGICEADPARRLYKVAVSRGNTFLSAKERFRVQVCFKNAITHPDEESAAGRAVDCSSLPG